MIENKLKRLLQSGGTAIGTTRSASTRTPAIARALAVAGFDYFILDTEHGSQPRNCLRHDADGAAGGHHPAGPRAGFLVPLHRADVGDRARWAMVPRIKTRAQVEQIVAAAKYPPMGEGNDERADQHRLPRDDHRRIRYLGQRGDHGDRPDRDP